MLNPRRAENEHTLPYPVRESSDVGLLVNDSEGLKLHLGGLELNPVELTFYYW